MEFKLYKAKTVNDAITDALIELEITSDMIEYEVIEEGSSGLLGLFSKDAVIKARRKEEVSAEEEDLFDIKAQFQSGSLLTPQKPKPAKKQAAPADMDPKAGKEVKEAVKAAGKNRQKTEKAAQNANPEKAPGKTPNKSVSKDQLKKHTEEKADKGMEKRVEEPAEKTPDEPFHDQNIDDILKVIFDKLGIEASVTSLINKGERVVNVIIDGDDTGDIIGKRGQTLDAIQYLLSIVVNKDQEAYYRVKLDTNNYRERRQKTLENLARNVAAKVKKTRRKVALEPMNPYERRVIHSYLQADKFVTTKSEGVEPNRRVVVYYKKP